MTQINCKPWKFKEGDFVAMVALYDPIPRPYTNLKQHFIFRGDWFPDNPDILDKHPELRFENTKFCGEHPNHCLSKLSLGLKIYMVVVNFGFIPEYYSSKAAIGWLILMFLISLMLL